MATAGTRKRCVDSKATSSASKLPRQVSKETFFKWKRDFEKECKSLTWLKADFDKVNNSLVSLLWGAACRQYEDRIGGHKNFSRAWIDGSSNHKTSNIKDHAKSEQHKAAMSLRHRE